MSEISELEAALGVPLKTEVVADDGTVFTIPSPYLLDDDQQERYEELQFDLEKCDRDASGDLLVPYRIDGKPLTPNYNTRLAKAILGDDYEAFKAAGFTGGRITLEWAAMNRPEE